MTDWDGLVRENVKDAKYGGLILTQLALVPNGEDRHAAAEWVRHMATTPGKRGKPYTPGAINNHVQAVAQFLRDRQGRPVREMTEREYQDYFIRRAKRPGDRGKGVPGEPGRLSAKLCYYHEIYVRKWLVFYLGPDVEGRLRRIGLQQHQEPDVEWVHWRDIERLAEKLGFDDRALLTALLATPLPPRSILAITADQVHSDDGLVYFELPANKACPLGQVVPLHHGDETIAAYARLRVRQDGPTARLWPMTLKEFTSKVETWGRRADIDHLSRRRLLMTCIATLIAEGASDQFIRHLMGVKDPRLGHRIRARVLAARKKGQDCGRPSTAVPEVRGGAVPCSACGKLDNPVGNVLCGSCGNRLSSRSLRAEEALKASILNRVGRLLDITGQSSRDRIQQALT